MIYSVTSEIDTEMLECSTLAAALDAYREAHGTRKQLWLQADDHTELLEDATTINWYCPRRR